MQGPVQVLGMDARALPAGSATPAPGEVRAAGWRVGHAGEQGGEKSVFYRQCPTALLALQTRVLVVISYNID